ncbi:MAG TPA: sulfotransferase [Thermoanaerobaculia bacterium]
MDGPCVIGATGGSGTRAFARIVRRGGVDIGSHVNVSEDALELAAFLDRWIDRFMSVSPLPPSMEARMLADLKDTLKRHQRGDGRSYGWKEPRSLFLLPFFVRHLSGLRLLHAVRDGRDIAFSSNQNQLRKHGRALLAPDEDAWPEPVRSIVLWSRVNGLTADYGEALLPGRYLRVRYEDLCAHPTDVVRRILDFFGLSGDAEEIARQEVLPAPSLGRWRRQDPDILARLHDAGGTALQRFGYETLV